MGPLSEDGVLGGFLEQGVGVGACSVHSTHRPGIAVPPGTVHQKKKKKKRILDEGLDRCFFLPNLRYWG